MEKKEIFGMLYILGFPAGLFRPGKSRQVLGTGRDRQDLEMLKVRGLFVPETKEVHKSQDFFFEGPGNSLSKKMSKNLHIRELPVI